MKYLLDTCVISEILRPKPSTKVTKWIKQEDETNFFISVLTIGELHKGIEKLDESRRKEELHNVGMHFAQAPTTYSGFGLGPRDPSLNLPVR